MPDDDSQQLVKHLRECDSRAATEVFDRYVLRLVALARNRISPKLASRVDPEDVVQSAYRSFFRRVSNDEIVLQRAGDLWRLLAAFTINKLRGQIEHHTAGRRDVDREHHGDSSNEAELFDFGTAEPTVEQVAMLSDEMADVMVRLVPRERAVLEGRLQGRTIEEIAAELHCSQRTVRRLLDRCRDLLERRLLNEPER
ncbi:MAG: sigma-70 family RNA polymerase sigma factor [Planctomycetota bacterium]